MGRLKEFNYEGSKVRTIIKKQELWFVSKDVCDILGIKNITQAMKRLESEDRAMFNIGRQGEVNFVNESGVYELIFGSRKPEAKQFKKWVKHEVLPSIRKYGAYFTPEKIEEVFSDPNTIINLATILKHEKQKYKQLKQKTEDDKPKISYYDLVLNSSDTLSITAIAKDYGKSGRWLNGKLHNLGIQYKHNGTWFLYSKFDYKGYTKSKTTIFTDKDGNTHSKIHTYWTEKGRMFIYEQLKKDSILPLECGAKQCSNKQYEETK